MKKAIVGLAIMATILGILRTGSGDDTGGALDTSLMLFPTAVVIYFGVLYFKSRQS